MNKFSTPKVEKPSAGKDFSLDNLGEYDPSATLGQFDENSLGWTASANDPLAMTLSTDMDPTFQLNGGSIDEWNWLQEMQAQAPGQSIGEWDFETGTVSYAADPFTAKGMNSGYALSSPEQLKYISPVSGRSAIPSVDYLGILDSTLMGMNFGNGSGLTTSMTPQDAKLDRLLNMSSGLKIGSSGDAVLALQQELGFTGKALDGKFGGGTNRALQDKISGLREVGENTKLLTEPEVQAFLSVLRFKESSNQYDIVTGSKIKFTDFSAHPRIKVWFKNPDGTKYPSTAAGAYQFTYDTWKDFGLSKGLSDFSPRSQDIAAVNLLRHLNVTSELKAGNLDKAFFNAGKRFDAFPLNETGISISKGNRSLEPLKNLYYLELERLNANK